MAIKAKIQVDTTEVQKGLKSVEKQASQTSSQVSKMSKSSSGGDFFKNIAQQISKMGKFAKVAAVVVGVVTAIVVIAKKVVSVVNALTSRLDGLAKQAKSVQMSATSFMALQHACNRAGIEMEKIIGIVNKIDYAMTHAQDGEKKYRDAFYDIGLSWRELNRMSPEKRLMAINRALQNMKSTGQAIPKSFYDIFGRKDMETFNKMTAEKDFNKFIAEAGALGFTVTPDMIKVVESYQDALGDVNQKILAMVSNWELSKKTVKGLKSIIEEITDMLPANGMVDKSMTPYFDGIGNVAKKMATKDTFTEEQKKAIVQQRMIETMGSRSAYERYEKMGVYDVTTGEFTMDRISKEDLDNEFSKIKPEIIMGKMTRLVQSAVFTAVQEVDSRFKADDKTTWVQQKKDDHLPTQKELTTARAQDDAEDLNRDLLKNVDAFEVQNLAANKFVDIEKKILEIENRRGVKLDDMIKKQLRMNAAVANQKLIEQQLEKYREQGAKSSSDFYAEMLGQMGADVGTVKDFFDSMKSVTGRDFGRPESLNASLMYQYYKNIDKIDPANSYDSAGNPLFKLAYETDQEYHSRYTTLKRAGLISMDPDRFMPQLLNSDPLTYFSLFKGIADDFNEQNIFHSLSSEKVKKARDIATSYKSFATSAGLSSVFKDATGAEFKVSEALDGLQFGSTDAQDQAEIYDRFTLAIETIEDQLQGPMMKIAELQGKIESFKQDDTLDEQKRQQKINEALRQIEMIKLNYPSFNMVDQLIEMRDSFATGKVIQEYSTQAKAGNQQKVAKARFGLYQESNQAADEISMQQAQYAGMNGMIDLYNRLNILKKMGVDATKENLNLFKDQLDVLTSQQDKLKQIGMLSSLRDKSHSIMTDALNAMGQGKLASILNARKEASQQVGRRLTGSETMLVDRLASLQHFMSSLGKFTPKNDIIKTNELAQRGGFTSSVRVERAGNQQEFLAYQKKIYEILRDTNRIQTQINSKIF